MGIELDEFNPPALSLEKPLVMPWYMNIDTTKLKTIKNTIAYKQQGEKLLGKNVLKEVVIKDMQIIKDSHNLNNGLQ